MLITVLGILTFMIVTYKTPMLNIHMYLHKCYTIYTTKHFQISRGNMPIFLYKPPDTLEIEKFQLYLKL